MFRDNLSFPSPRFKHSKKNLDCMTLEDGPECCPEPSVTNHQSMLRNISEERRFLCAPPYKPEMNQFLLSSRLRMRVAIPPALRSSSWSCLTARSLKYINLQTTDVEKVCVLPRLPLRMLPR
jgi:hypothetical protein